MTNQKYCYQAFRLIYFVALSQHTTCKRIGVCCHRSGDLPTHEDLMAADELPRVSCHGLSSLEFQQVFEQTKEPVVFVGCDKDWLAKDTWRLDSLIHRFDLASKWRVVLLEDSDAAAGDERIQWKNVVKNFQNNKKFYVFDNLNTTYGQRLEIEYSTPSLFSKDVFEYFDFPVDYGPMRWFALGSKFTGTFPHFDPFGTDAWNSVVHGMKWWMLFPPLSHSYLDEDYDYLGCDYSCSDENISIVDYYSTIWSNDSIISEMFGGKSIKHVIQNEGETVYIPSGVIHR